MLYFLLFTVQVHERKWGVTSKSPDVAEKLVFWGRSALFPWLPFDKIPTVGISSNSVSTRGCPAVGWFGLRQGVGAGYSLAQTSTACGLGSADPSSFSIILRAATSHFFLLLPSPSSRLAPLQGHTAITGRIIKPRNGKENADLMEPNQDSIAKRTPEFSPQPLCLPSVICLYPAKKPQPNKPKPTQNKTTPVSRKCC